MNKKIKLIIEIVLFIVILISITVIYNYFINKNIEKTIQEDTKNEENIEIIEIESMEQFEQEVSNENGTIFIDFYATWCMPCKTMTPIIEELAKENKEVKFLKVDVDKNNELATKYNVMSIPTMLIIKNGKVTKIFVGVTDKESIMKEL